MMTAFFLSSRDQARYLMEKYWIWCVVETVDKLVKSFREGFEGRLVLYPATLASINV